MFCKQILRPIFRSGKTLMRSKHTLPELPYAYEALEPIISREIMELHHSKHHQAYVNNLNAAEEKLEKALKDNDVGEIISLGQAIRFNGGGHINHSIFWQNLCTKANKATPELCAAIACDFGSFDNLKKQLVAQTVAIQGSGWGWLGYNPQNKRLAITTMGQQDPLRSITGHIPLLGIDVWEHAYYLQYKNNRASYVEAIFEIINWEDVSKRFNEATTG